MDTQIKPVIIETHDEKGAEWGISFNGHNPEAHDYFQMKDKESAFRLKERLESESTKPNQHE